jgi:hypothetical protein
VNLVLIKNGYGQRHQHIPRPYECNTTIDLWNEEIAKQLNDKILKAEAVIGSAFLHHSYCAPHVYYLKTSISLYVGVLFDYGFKTLKEELIMPKKS